MTPEVTSSLSFSQVGDADDPVLPDALTVDPGGVEESDRHVCDAAVPQHGKGPVLHSSADHRELMQTAVGPPSDRMQSEETRVNRAFSGIHELFIK